MPIAPFPSGRTIWYFPIRPESSLGDGGEFGSGGVIPRTVEGKRPGVSRRARGRFTGPRARCGLAADYLALLPTTVKCPRRFFIQQSSLCSLQIGTSCP